MSLTPLIALHLSVALAAVVIGPFAFWARLGRTVRPRWHRALGYAWFSCMAVTVLSALFIRSHDLPNIAAVMRGDIALHRRTMQRVYIGACLVAGAFTLLPSRYLGQLIWGQWLGWL